VNTERRRTALGSSGPTRRRWTYLAVLASAALFLAACGSGSSSSSKATTGSAGTTASSPASGVSTASAPPATGTAAQLQALLQNTFHGTVTSSQFSPIVLQSLQIAAKPLTPAQQTLLLHCLNVETCVIGKGPLTVGLAETNGVNGLRRLWRLEATAQAMAYPEVGKVVYLDAHDDLPTFLSNFRSLISQKVSMIIGAYDFGAAILPVAKQAMKAGIDVISLEAIPGAQAGVDYGVQVGVADECQTWTSEAQTAVKALGNDKTYGFYTGPAGNPYAAVWEPCATKVLAAAGWKEVISGNTDWTPQGEQQAGTALIASGKQVSAIFYDYNSENLIQPFISAHKTPPAIFGQSSDAALWKLYQTAAAAGIHLTVYVEASTSSYTIRAAVTAGVEKAEGQQVNPNVNIPFVLTPLSSLIANFNSAYPAQTPMPAIVSPTLAEEALSS
jgi:ABC-type sugar transport system substrate-binding protein